MFQTADIHRLGPRIVRGECEKGMHGLFLGKKAWLPCQRHEGKSNCHAERGMAV